MPATRFAFPKRSSMALSTKAYRCIKRPNATYGYGNNNMLRVMQEGFDAVINQRALRKKVFREFAKQDGTPYRND